MFERDREADDGGSHRQKSRAPKSERELSPCVWRVQRGARVRQSWAWTYRSGWISRRTRRGIRVDPSRCSSRASWCPLSR